MEVTDFRRGPLGVSVPGVTRSTSLPLGGGPGLRAGTCPPRPDLLLFQVRLQTW